VEARDRRDDLDLLWSEAAELAVQDQVLRMLVMLGVVHVEADVVEQSGELDELALALAEAVDRRASNRTAGAPAPHVTAVGVVGAQPLGELQHAPPPQIRHPIGGVRARRDWRSMKSRQDPLASAQSQTRSSGIRARASTTEAITVPGRDEIDALAVEAREIGAPGGIGAEHDVAKPVEIRDPKRAPWSRLAKPGPQTPPAMRSS